MMSTHDRIQAVTEFGFTERQARFLVLVMRHAGVCVPRQYARLPASRTGRSATPSSTSLSGVAVRTPVGASTTARGFTTFIPNRCITSSAKPGAGIADPCRHASRSSG